MRLIFTCPTCKSAKSEILKESKLGSIIFKTLSCGHVITERRMDTRSIIKTLNDGRELYPFQGIGAEFARDNGFRVLIADEMGLGKTIQVIAILKTFPELQPCLCIVKSSLIVNWLRELFNGAGIVSQVLDSDSVPVYGNGKITVGAYITSYDSLVKKRTKKQEPKPAVWREHLKDKINLLVLDEVQMIKNHDSKRTQQVRDIARNIKHIVALSGTPILNNFGEYFPVLNMLDPAHWGNRTDFIRFEANSYWDGYRYKIGGARDPEGFAAKVKNLVIRRTRKEVLPDLPKTRISLRYMTMENEARKAYERDLDEMTEYVQEHGDEETVDNILAFMNKMRHKVGLAKVADVQDYVMEFLEDREGEEKLTIFHHHHDVAEAIIMVIKGLLEDRGLGEKVLQLKGSQDSGQRQEIIDEFRENSKARFLVAPTLACGEGINLQFCSTGLLAEREWNPGKEEQAAPGRFSRIGSLAQFVDVVISVAINSIDELFAEYIERKRQYVTETMEGRRLDLSERWNQTTIMKDIAAKLVEGNMRSWRARVGV